MTQTASAPARRRRALSYSEAHRVAGRPTAGARSVAKQAAKVAR